MDTAPAEDTEISANGDVPTADKKGAASEEDSLLESRPRKERHRDRAESADSEASSRKINVQGVTGSESSDLTPIEGDDGGVETTSDRAPIMATVISDRYSMSRDDDDDGENGDAKRPRGLFDQAQAGVMELATMITDEGLKRSESSDVLHLNLHQVARDGDVDTMKKFLQYMTGNKKKKVNAHDDEDVSALHYAARYNHHGVVKLLVENEANVNDVDEDGATPLHYAARYKRMRLSTLSPEEGVEDAFNSTPDNSVIMYLVSVNADLNKKDVYGCPPLHFAAMRGNEVAAKELLTCDGINIEAIDLQQMTALHLAASHNEVEIVRMLIEQGANLRCVDEDEGTPLHFACMEGSMEVACMLFEAGEKQDGWVTVSQMVTDQDNQQNTPLHLAVENRSFEVGELCIQKGANVNTPRQNYQTPIHLAAAAGEAKIVELLTEHGARIDALDINQETPLYKAAKHDRSDCINFLLDKGAKINRHDKDGFSPLLIAASEGHAESIQTLLDRGANLFDVDKNDKTALFWAAEEDSTDTLKVLLAHPQSRHLLDLSDRYSNTPLHIAAKKGYINCVKLLLEAGADMDSKNEEEQTPLHLAAQQGKTIVVRELVRRDRMVVNDEDEESNTALHLAALAGHNKVTYALIEAGADIEARNCNLWTPLDCAAAKGWHKTCRVLLEADSPVDPVDKSKTTPLHLASSRGHVSVVQLLISWQAKVSQTDAEGNNCLDLAIDNGHEDVAMAIVGTDHWRQAMMNEAIELNTGLRVTPMRKLIRKMPDVAEKVFNRCTNSNIKNSDHPDFKITFNYEFLDDMYSNWRNSYDSMSDTLSTESIYDEENHLMEDARPYTTDTTVLKTNHPLFIMVKENQEDLLAHPLVTALLRHKWMGYGRIVYYLNLFIYCILVTFLTGYIWTTKPPYMYYNATAGDNTPLPDSTDDFSSCESIRKYYDANADVTLAQHVFARIGKYIIIVVVIFKMLTEIFQMFNAKLHYLGWENAIEWAVYIFSLLLVIDFNACEQETGIRAGWQWQLGAIAIFLAWINLVLFIRKVPRFGIYVVMFTDVLRTFIQFFPVFFLFIVAFALAFFALLQNQYEFRNVGVAMIKTSVMMIGEIEFSDLFLSLEDQNEDSLGAFGDHTFYEAVTYGLFVLFLIIMTIILMNLLYEFRNVGISMIKTAVMMIGEIDFGSIYLSLEGQDPDHMATFGDQSFYGIVAYPLFVLFLVVMTILIMNLLGEFIAVPMALLKTSVMMIGEFEFSAIFLESDDGMRNTQIFLPEATYAIFVFFQIIMAILIMNLLIEFTDIPVSLVKCLVMMIGEFDWGDIFLEKVEQISTDGYVKRADDVPYSFVTYIMFVLFVIIMTILIMNLLVGLAVDDIKAVQEQAVLKRLAMQVELALDVEAVLPHFLRRKWILKCETLSPNEKSGNPCKRLLKMESSFLSGAAITKALDPPLDEMEQLEENQEKMMVQISNLRTRVKGLTETNERMESMLKALLSHQGVTWDEEDESKEEI